MSRPSVHYSQAPPSGPGLASASLPPPPSSATTHHLHHTTTAHPPGRTLPSIHNPGGNSALPQPQPSYPPSTPNGPPMQFPNSATTTAKQDTPEHAFGDRSARGTPSGRHPSEFPPPPQRTPSTPAHPPQDRLMEAGPHHPYSAPHEQVHYAPTYPNPHPPPGSLQHGPHPELPPHMQPMIESSVYGHPPPPPGPYAQPGYAYYTTHIPPSQSGKQKRPSRASLVSRPCSCKV